MIYANLDSPYRGQCNGPWKNNIGSLIADQITDRIINFVMVQYWNLHCHFVLGCNCPRRESLPRQCRKLYGPGSRPLKQFRIGPVLNLFWLIPYILYRATTGPVQAKLCRPDTGLVQGRYQINYTGPVLGHYSQNHIGPVSGASIIWACVEHVHRKHRRGSADKE